MRFNIDFFFKRNSNLLQYTLIAIAVILGVVAVANLYTWTRIVKNLIFSQRKKLQRSVYQMQSLRAEGYLQVGLVQTFG